MNAALLTNLYYYQNPNTKQPSSSAVSVKQLCRIICPISASGGSTLINGSTPILAFDPVTNTYDEAGWKAANTVPILRESLSLWHYEVIHKAKADENDENSCTAAVKGPIDCRKLASIYYDATAQVCNETRVWCPEVGEWKKIIEIPDLINAFEAIDGPKVDAAFRFDQDRNESSANDQIHEKPERKHDESKLEDFFTSTNTSTDLEEEANGDNGASGHTSGMEHQSIVEASLSKKRKAGSKAIDSLVLANKKKKKKKPKFKAKNAKNWVYVTGLPSDTNEKEVASFFAKVGILDIDPESQAPKVKLYRYQEGENTPEDKPAKHGSPKGDATICYARPESVNLALQLLDTAVFRSVDSSGKFIENVSRISVQRAKFQQHGEEYKKRSKVSDVKRKVVRIAKLQAVGWDEGENGYITGGLKGLRIIVLKQAFDTIALRRAGKSEEDLFLKGVERQIKEKCEEFGIVEKITIFSSRNDGVVIVKFTQPTAASAAIEAYHGEIEQGRTIEAKFWDGVTDFTQHNLEKEANETDKRHDDFGNWLDEQELPEEFQLQVEGS